jgi:hypothetical protein
LCLFCAEEFFRHFPNISTQKVCACIAFWSGSLPDVNKTRDIAMANRKWPNLGEFLGEGLGIEMGIREEN